ncbi:molybdopterin-dependent oxidoreductase [Nocardia sp. NBC_00511]|uniref:molybdopterin-dependent oxidoreductase n=1 Tax=Nocardia sp. NBC_00511 TaxID=2903591 RepID=UPI003869BB45
MPSDNPGRSSGADPATPDPNRPETAGESKPSARAGGNGTPETEPGVPGGSTSAAVAGHSDGLSAAALSEQHGSSNGADGPPDRAVASESAAPRGGVATVRADTDADGAARPPLMVPAALADRISPARSTAVAARAGVLLGIGILILFVTGMISHLIQHPPDWFWWPAHPVWLYRVTQGVHVTVGVMMIPVLLVKFWSVYPRFFIKPSLRRGPVELLERGSVAVLIGAVLFQIVTGLFNTAQFYPWKFFFTTTHHAMAYVAFGAVVVHLAVKLPVVRQALTAPVREPEEAVGQEDSAANTGRTGVSRRAVLAAAGIGSVAAGVAVAGQSVPLLRRVSVLAPRSGEGPQGVPINRTAAAAGVLETARSAGYLLTVKAGGREHGFTRAELEALPQYDSVLPIACVEGWSATGHWSGVRLRDLLAAVGEYGGGDVRFVSMETTGIYGSSVLPHPHVVDASTLVALRLGGADLTLDHGYPCRLIAPNRPGVLQTKWLKSIEELS